MRKLAAVLAFVGFTLGLVALPATASAQTASPTTPVGGGPNPLVSGPFTGTGSLANTTSCPGLSLYEVLDGSYLPTPAQSGRSGTFQLDGCGTIVFAPSVSITFSGTFMLTAPNGAIMNGTAAGTNTPGLNNPGPLSIALTPTSGTMQFANVGGVVELTGTFGPLTLGNGLVTGTGPISGSLAGALTR